MLAERTRPLPRTTARPGRLALFGARSLTVFALSGCPSEVQPTTPLVFDAPRPITESPTARPPTLGPGISRSPRVDEAAADALLASLDAPPVELPRLDVPPCDPTRSDEVCTRGLSLTALAVVNTARGEARGASFPGALYSGLLSEGQRAEVQLATEVTGREGLPDESKCYTVIAHGGGSIMEVDAFVGSRDGASLSVLGHDRLRGPSAIAGGRTGCISAPNGVVDLRAIVRVREGRGLVVMGVYELSSP